MLDGTVTLDGEGILWFQDETGDESGQWPVQPFHGGETTRLDGVPHGWSEGLAQAPGIVVVGISDRDGFAVHVSLDGGPAAEVYRSTESVRLGGVDGGFSEGALSEDGSLLCPSTPSTATSSTLALRMVDPRTGATAGDLVDPGMSLGARRWPPLPGERRLAFEHEREGESVPGSGTRDRGVDRPPRRSMAPCSWRLGGRTAPPSSSRIGREAGIACTGTTSRPVSSPPCRATRVRLDGRAPPTDVSGSCTSRGNCQRLVLDEVSGAWPADRGARAARRPHESCTTVNPHGQQVHGFYVTPTTPAGRSPC